MSPSPAAPRRHRLRLPLLFAAGALSAGLIAATGTASEPKATAAPAPQRVTVVEVHPQSVASEQFYAARAAGAKHVDVRARVPGILLKRFYTEGEFVERGATLFQIDPAELQVEVQRAEAELASATAKLNKAERDWQRVSSLFGSGAISAGQRDDTRSALELATAGVAMAKAALHQTRIQLNYTAVTAPISGITSLQAQDPGNLVQDQTLLTTITELDPIHVQFALPEAQALALRRQLREGAAAAVLKLADGSTYTVEGKVDFAESSVDPKTGTVQARAIFANPQHELMPGQFVRIGLPQLQAGTELVVPQTAVTQSADGPVVYVVGRDNTALPRTVELGRSVGGALVIRAGLRNGELIVVDGIATLRPGSKVEVINPASPGATAADNAIRPSAAVTGGA